MVIDKLNANVCTPSRSHRRWKQGELPSGTGFTSVQWRFVIGQVLLRSRTPWGGADKHLLEEGFSSSAKKVIVADGVQEKKRKVSYTSANRSWTVMWNHVVPRLVGTANDGKDQKWTHQNRRLSSFTTILVPEDYGNMVESFAFWYSCLPASLVQRDTDGIRFFELRALGYATYGESHTLIRSLKHLADNGSKDDRSICSAYETLVELAVSHCSGRVAAHIYQHSIAQYRLLFKYSRYTSLGVVCASDYHIAMVLLWHRARAMIWVNV